MKKNRTPFAITSLIKLLSWLCTPFKVIRRIVLYLSVKREKKYRNLPIDYSYNYDIDKYTKDLDDAWDDLAISQDEKTLTKEHLELFEDSKPVGFRNIYVTIREEDSIVAIVYIQKLSGRSLIINAPESKFLKFITKAYMTVKTCIFPILVFGHVFRNNTTHFTWDKKKLTTVEAAELLSKVLNKIEDRFIPSMIIIKDVEQKLFKELHKINDEFRPIIGDYGMKMTINPQWTKIDDYVTALEGSYRSNFKKKREKMKTIEIKELSVEDIILYRAKIWKLYYNVLKHQPFGFGVVPPDYYMSLKGFYKEEFKIFGFFRGKQLIAFSSAFLTENRCEIYYIGMNYECNNKYDLYFNILYHAVEIAIKYKKSELFLGRSAPDPKARLGCIDVPMNSLYKIDHPILKRLIKIRFIKQKRSWRKYSVFKKIQHI